MARNGRYLRRADYNEIIKTYRAGLGIYLWCRRIEFVSGLMVASILRRDIDDGDARTPLQGDQLLRARIIQFVRVPRETVASHRLECSGGWRMRSICRSVQRLRLH